LSVSTINTLPRLDPSLDDASMLWGLKRSTWMQIGIIAGLFLLLFWPNLRRLWIKTNPIYGEPNWGHSVCVPLIGLYYLYVNREALLKAKVQAMLPGRFTRRGLISSATMIVAGLGIYLGGMLVIPSFVPQYAAYVESLGQGAMVWGALAMVLNWGLGSMFFGLLTFAFGIWPGSNDYTKDVGMVITLFGTVLFLCGWDVMRITWFPIAFLICALPLPPLLYSGIALPLQNLAAKVAVAVLQMTGVTSFKFGTKITIGDIGGPTRSLNVAEACAGLRSLMTFITVGAAVAFLSSRPLWQKAILTISAVPIAIFCNVMRVTGQGLLDYYWSHELAEGFAHTFVGMVMLIPGFFMILGMGWLLDRLFVDVVDESDARGSVTSPAARPKQDMVIAIPRRAGAGPVSGSAQQNAPDTTVTPKTPIPNTASPSSPRPAPAVAKPIGVPLPARSPQSAQSPATPRAPGAPSRPSLAGVIPPPPASSPRGLPRHSPPPEGR